MRYTELLRMVADHLEQQMREKHFSPRDRLNDKATPVVAAIRDKGKGKGKRERVLRSMDKKRSVLRRTSLQFQA